MNTGDDRTKPHVTPEVSALTDSTALFDQRLTELEIKASFAEDLIDSLNDTIIRQQQHIDFLLRELGQLRMQQQQDGGGGAFRSLRDELPPHY